MRLFAAVSLPPAVVAPLEGVLDLLRVKLPGLSVVRPEALHLTLRFYGELDETEARGLGALFSAARLATPAARMVVGGYGQFPSRGEPRVLWTGLRSGGDVVCGLWREITALTSGFGEAPESDYTPHVTLARDRRGAVRGRAEELGAVRRALDVLSLEAPVAGVRLYRSDLGGGSPRYTVLAEAPCAP